MSIKAGIAERGVLSLYVYTFEVRFVGSDDLLVDRVLIKTAMYVIMYRS